MLATVMIDGTRVPRCSTAAYLAKLHAELVKMVREARLGEQQASQLLCCRASSRVARYRPTVRYGNRGLLGRAEAFVAQRSRGLVLVMSAAAARDDRESRDLGDRAPRQLQRIDNRAIDGAGQVFSTGSG